jgi:ABC-type antimicrobial peptide transport system permease subunit
MNFIEIVRIAFEAIRATKLRSLLTTLGIVIGVAAVITMVARCRDIFLRAFRLGIAQPFGAADLVLFRQFFLARFDGRFLGAVVADEFPA